MKKYSLQEYTAEKRARHPERISPPSMASSSESRDLLAGLPGHTAGITGWTTAEAQLLRVLAAGPADADILLRPAEYLRDFDFQPADADSTDDDSGDESTEEACNVTSDESGEDSGDEALDEAFDDQFDWSSTEISLLRFLEHDTIAQVASEAGLTTQEVSVLRTFFAKKLASEFEDELTIPSHGESSSSSNPYYLPIPSLLVASLPTHSAPPQAPAPRTGFVSLPPELRNEIYRLAIINHQSQTRVTTPPGIINVCRETRNESNKLYYASCHFRIHAKDVARWAEAIGEANVKDIRHLRVDLDAYFLARHSVGQLDVDVHLDLHFSVLGSGDRFVAGVIEMNHIGTEAKLISSVPIPKSLVVSARTATEIGHYPKLLLEQMVMFVSGRSCVGFQDRSGNLHITMELLDLVSIWDD